MTNPAIEERSDSEVEPENVSKKSGILNRGWNGFKRITVTMAVVRISIIAFLGVVVGMALMLDRPFSAWLADLRGDKYFATIHVIGPIASGQKADTNRLIPAFRKAISSRGSRGVVLRINSPGGSAVLSEQFYAEIKAIRKDYPDVPVYASIEEVGASGAYFIAAAADTIYANPSSIVGSIGVVSSSFGYYGLMEILGVERRVFTAGNHKNLLDPFTPMKDETRGYVESMLNAVHEEFIARVKEGRAGALVNVTEDVFSGLVWNGTQALELGLIDKLGSFHALMRHEADGIRAIDFTPRGLREVIGDGASAILRSMETPQTTIEMR